MKINNQKQNNDNLLYVFCADTLFIQDVVSSCSFFAEKIRVIYHAMEKNAEEIEAKLYEVYSILFDEMTRDRKIEDFFK